MRGSMQEKAQLAFSAAGCVYFHYGEFSEYPDWDCVVVWNGSHTFNIYDSTLTLIDMWTWYPEVKIDRAEAYHHMRDHMAEYWSTT